MVIVLVFILCWLPFHVSRTLFSVSDSSDNLYYISQYFNLVSLVLFYVSAAVNPLLYNIMSARYRASVLALLRLTVGSTDELHHRARNSPLTASHSSTHFWTWNTIHLHFLSFWNVSGALATGLRSVSWPVKNMKMAKGIKVTWLTQANSFCRINMEVHDM